MMTPTITLMQKSRVSVLVKRLRYSLCQGERLPEPGRVAEGPQG